MILPIDEIRSLSEDLGIPVAENIHEDLNVLRLKLNEVIKVVNVITQEPFFSPLYLKADE